MLIFVLSEFDELQVKGATNEKLQLNERKIVQVECKEVYFNLPRRSLSYVKIVQVECKEVSLFAKTPPVLCKKTNTFALLLYGNTVT